MSAAAPDAWAIHTFSHGTVRVPLRIARCPGCERDPATGCASACARTGCPMKHLATRDHERLSA